jgi:hypothetical protein
MLLEAIRGRPAGDIAARLQLDPGHAVGSDQHLAREDAVRANRVSCEPMRWLAAARLAGAGCWPLTVNEAAIAPPPVLPEEPAAVTPHGGICGGKSQQWLRYPINASGTALYQGPGRSI